MNPTPAEMASFRKTFLPFGPPLHPPQGAQLRRAAQLLTKDLDQVGLGLRLVAPGGRHRRAAPVLCRAAPWRDTITSRRGAGGYRGGAEGAMISRCLLFVALVLFPSASNANEVSANMIMPGCRAALGRPSPENDYLRGICTGIVFALNVGVGSIYCPPTGVTTEQVLRVIVQYIDQRPTRMHEPFLTLATEAHRAAWPCPSGRRSN